MTNRLLDDSEYPYHARYGAPLRPQPAAAVPRHPLPWKLIRRWAVRVAMASAALALLVTVLLVAFFGRAASRAWTLAALDERGAYLDYQHEVSSLPDPLPPPLRDRLGPHWWSEPVALRYSGDGFFSRSFGYQDVSADDVAWVARQCGRFQRLESLVFQSDLLQGTHLKNWGQLQSLDRLDLESNQLNDDDLATISKLKGVTGLRLARITISNNGLKYLSQMPNLQRLTLHDVRYERSNHVGAERFESLQALVVSQSAAVDDAAIKAFGELPQLEEINFHQTPLGDAGFAHLVRRADMQNVTVNQGRLTDAALRHVAEFPRVRWMDLSGMPLTDQGLEALAGKEFESLTLDQTALTDAGIPALAKIEGLVHLSLSGTAVAGEAFAAFAEKKLSYLELMQTKLSKAGIAQLAKLNVESLMLAETALDDQDLLLFVENPSLQTLGVQNTQVTVEGIQAFHKARQKHSRAGRSLPAVSIEGEFTEDPAFLRGFDPATGLPLVDPGEEPPPSDE